MTRKQGNHVLKGIPADRQRRIKFAAKLQELRLALPVSAEEMRARLKRQKRFHNTPLTLREFGARCRATARRSFGFTKPQLSVYECGHRMPGLDAMNILAKTLGTSITVLLDVQLPPPKPKKK